MKLLAIDGNSIINRAYYGIKPLTNKDGIYTNAIMGFVNILQRVLADIKPDCTVVAWDLKSPTFRHKKVATYKATRKPMQPELAMQFPYVKEILKCLGIMGVECEGYEADDILGTFAKSCDEKNIECVVLTGDRDSLQLITNNVNVCLAKNTNNVLYNSAMFKYEYGFEPIELIDYKALAGDSSDNISGVPGIGDVTAKKLIAEYHTIENIFENIDTCGIKGAMLNKLKNGKAAAEESKWLATIYCEVPIETDIEKYKIADVDSKRLSEILTDLEMFKTLDKLRLKPIKPKKSDKFQPSLFDTPPENIAPIEEIIAENMEFFGDNDLYYIFENDRVKIAFNGKIYIPADKFDFFVSENKKYTFSAKELHFYCRAHCFELKNLVFDAEIAAYLLNPNTKQYSIKNLCGEYRVEYINDVLSLPKLCEKLSKRIIDNNLEEVLYNIELPLTKVLADMELYGFHLDKQGLVKFGEKLAVEIDVLTEEIYKSAGHEFNISSPKQLSEVLFDELLLPVKKKTASGGYSTDAAVLEELVDKDPIISQILEYRKCTKLKSTYVEGLLKVVNNQGTIHTTFVQTETRTGRISSIEPNLQNIPIRTELGREMRKFFVAGENKVLVDADYSQIELRILAHISGDENMQQAFADNVDIHTRTAAQVYGCEEYQVTKTMRSNAKAVNFGIIYGMGAFSLSKEIGVSVPEAKRYIEKYFAKFPKVKEYFDQLLENAHRDGFVTTLSGRKRNIPELAMTNKNVRASGERIARNTPIQGAAADIIKLAMVKVYNRLEKEFDLKTRLILQVHDELIVETPEENAEKVAEILKEEMENAYKLDVPLLVEVNYGKNWYDAKG